MRTCFNARFRYLLQFVLLLLLIPNTGCWLIGPRDYAVEPVYIHYLKEEHLPASARQIIAAVYPQARIASITSAGTPNGPYGGCDIVLILGDGTSLSLQAHLDDGKVWRWDDSTRSWTALDETSQPGR